MNILELVVILKPGKSKEFKQSLQLLKEKIENFSTSFETYESEDTHSYCVKFGWETDLQMKQALKEKEFIILSGALNSLCEKTIIRLNGTLVGNYISWLSEILV